MSRTAAREGEVESRFEATFAVGLVIGLQVTLALVSLAGGWKLIGLQGWVWMIPAVPEAALLLALAWSAPRHRLEQMGHRRTLALVGVISTANVLALLALIASLLSAQEKSGGELLLKGATIWSTNVITFGLLFWEFDRGGPMRRRAPDPRPPDFQFPQDENPTLAEPDWHPRLADYVYISFTNAIAFSPTDAMPLTQTASMTALIRERPLDVRHALLWTSCRLSAPHPRAVPLSRGVDALERLQDSWLDSRDDRHADDDAGLAAGEERGRGRPAREPCFVRHAVTRVVPAASSGGRATGEGAVAVTAPSRIACWLY